MVEKNRVSVLALRLFLVCFMPIMSLICLALWFLSVERISASWNFGVCLHNALWVPFPTSMSYIFMLSRSRCRSQTIFCFTNIVIWETWNLVYHMRLLIYRNFVFQLTKRCFCPDYYYLFQRFFYQYLWKCVWFSHMSLWTYGTEINLVRSFVSALSELRLAVLFVVLSITSLMSFVG